MVKRKKYNYRYAKDVIEARGGELLSKDYSNTKTKMTIKCNLGHIWATSLGRVIYVNSWCPVCANNKIAEFNKKYSEEYVVDYLNNYGWTLLSEYENTNKHIKVECAKCNWVWETRFSKILAGSGCKRCSSTTNSIYDANNIAQDRGGECLTTIYINNKTKMIWKCSKGHIWEAKFNDIKGGSWCPSCRFGRSQRELSGVIKELLKMDVYENFRGFSWLKNKNTGYRLEIDIWVPELKLAIEYDGAQHFEPVTFGGVSWAQASDNLIKQQSRDLQKNLLVDGHSDITHFIRFNFREKITKESVKLKLIKGGISIDG